LALVRGHATLGSGVKGTATLDIRSLAPFAALAGLELEGSAHAAATLETKGGKTAATLDGTLGVTGGDATISVLMGRNAKFGFAGSVKGGDIALERATVDGAYVALSANGGLDGTLAIDWTANLRDLSRVASTLSGRLSLRGHVKGPRDNFEITVAGDGDIAGGKAARGPVRLAARIGGLPDAPQGWISMDGRLNGGALRMRADLLLARGADFPTGKISLQDQQLSDLQPFLGFDISGSLAASADLRA